MNAFSPYETIDFIDFLRKFQDMRVILDYLYSDDFSELSQNDYEVIDENRNIRNYCCHQCYLVFVYIQDIQQREQAFQTIAQRLYYDEN